jgi:hypothetical protein
MYLFKATENTSNTKIDLKYILCSWEEFIVNKNIEDWCIWGLWFKDIDYKIFSSFFAYNKIYPDNDLNNRKQKSSNTYFCLSEVIKTLHLFIDNNEVYLFNKKSLKDYIKEEFNYINQNSLLNAPSENSNKFKNPNQQKNLNSLENTKNKTIHNKYIKSRKKWYKKWNSKEWVISIICVIVVLLMTAFGTTTFGTTRKIYLEDNGDRTKVTKITIKESVAPRPEFIVLGL